MKNSTFEERREFYRNAIAVKESVTSALRDKNYHNLADHPNVTVYTGVGSFVSADVVSVRTSTEEIWLTSKQIIINTGAETIIPPIEGIADNSLVYTSTSIMELTDLPRRLVIVGGGYIGLEFASMYASFGSQVTVLESYPELIAREDRDIAASVKETLEKKGIVFRMNVKVQSVRHVEIGLSLFFLTHKQVKRSDLKLMLSCWLRGANPIRKILIWKLPEWRRTHVERSLWMNI